MTSLVGNTGFVGSNLCSAFKFDAVYHSTDVSSAYGTRPDLLIYAGVRAQKTLANNNSEMDLAHILEAEKNLEMIDPQKLVLISTVDVFRKPVLVDEKSPVETNGLHAYGRNRLKLEQWVRERFPDALIVRLPALFGNNLKKNFIYDMIRVIPSMLRPELYRKLAAEDPLIARSYTAGKNGFFCLSVQESETKDLKKHFQEADFTAVKFTDSRSSFQFYPLGRLWNDINTALSSGITLWHAATEPISAAQIHEYLTGKPFVNETASGPVHYDYRTCFAETFDGNEGYILHKERVLDELKEFYLRNIAS